MANRLTQVFLLDAESRMFDFLIARCRSIGCAVAGVRHVLRSQQNVRVHAVATVIVVTCGALLRLSAGEWCWMIVATAGVCSAESMNTALELLCDAACPEFHPLIGKAKDVAAGAVLVTAVAAVGIGICVLGPHLV